MKFLLAVVFLFSVTSHQSFASTEVSFGNCNITPQEYHGSNPELSGNTFSVKCDGAGNSNVTDLNWKNTTGKEINQYSFAFSSVGPNYYWYQTSKSDQYTKSAVTINEVINPSESINYKVMLNPSDYINNASSKITLTFQYCSVPNSSYSCETIKQETVNLTASMILTLPDPALNTSMLSFGSISIGESNEKTFSISNNSTSTPYIFKVSKTGGNLEGFEISDGFGSKIDSNDSVSLNAGESKSYKVKFNPSESKDYTLRISLAPFDSEMAKHIPSKLLTFSGQGMQTVEETSSDSSSNNNEETYSETAASSNGASINITRLSEETLPKSFKANWELKAEGSPSNFPWTVQINTNCEGMGLENNGSFKWEVGSLGSGEAFTFSNSIEHESLSDNAYSSEFIVTNSLGETIHTQYLPGLSCFDTPEANDVLKDRNNSKSSNPSPSQQQQMQQRQGSKNQPVLSSENMTLEDLEQQKLNIDGKIKGESDESGNGFITRLLGYIAVVGGIAAATIYMKKGMVVDKVIIPDTPGVYEDVLSKDSTDSDTDKSVTNIKLE